MLVDAGLFGTKRFIAGTAEKRFGQNGRPAAVILTHGHFDHVGALADLASERDVPVFAQPLEHPYLNGSESYPAPDPSVGGGLLALSSALFPRAPVNIQIGLSHYRRTARFLTCRAGIGSTRQVIPVAMSLYGGQKTSASSRVTLS